jgi:tRNA dimethylallyltransferase
MKPFVLVVGPTGSGKSALAMQLAREFGAGILNCDSLQVYQRLDIGTAKPSPSERAQVPHFLFDILPPGEVLTAGDFRRSALRVLEHELAQRLMIGVGGSGFYIQALEKGMFDVPKPNPEIDQQVREECERLGPAAAYAKLLTLDPEYAADISPNDTYRVVRALVVLADTGQKVSEVRRQFKAQPFPFPLLKLGLAPAREQLLPKVQRRTAEMLDRGLIDEVRQLLQQGLGDWPALQSVGYKECVQFLKGEWTREELDGRIVEKTMQLAKKQRTWFKRDTEIQWLSQDTAFAEAKELIARFISGVGVQ